MAGWLDSCLAARLVAWVAAWLDGCMVAWQDGRFLAARRPLILRQLLVGLPARPLAARRRMLLLRLLLLVGLPAGNASAGWLVGWSWLAGAGWLVGSL